MSETLRIGAREFTVETVDDDDSTPPWEMADGHGPVSDWRQCESWSGRYPKAPGEILLCQDHGCARFYDWRLATRIAKRDGWGAVGDEGLTRGEKARKAVQADYDRLRQWCNDIWRYVGVVVTDTESGEEASLWGIESDGGYWRECAVDLAREMMPDQMSLPGLEEKVEWQ